jgi:hypothetical protein
LPNAGSALTTPAGLSPGDTFRFVFVTDGTTAATSSNIADYNAFVNAQAEGATYNGATVSWVAIGSTATTNAIQNVGQTDMSVYLADGSLVTKSTTSTGLWSFSLINPINEDLSGTPPFSGAEVWTGTGPDGKLADPLGSLLINAGVADQQVSTWVAFTSLPLTSSALFMYVISSILTVQGTAVPEPTSLVMLAIGVFGLLGFARCRHQH